MLLVPDASASSRPVATLDGHAGDVYSAPGENVKHLVEAAAVNYSGPRASADDSQVAGHVQAEIADLLTLRRICGTDSVPQASVSDDLLNDEEASHDPEPA